MNKDSLGDRMKYYESVTDYTLTKRVPVIIRLDGRAFHTLTKKYYNKGSYQRGYDFDFVNNMIYTCLYVQEHIQGCTLAYCQSDEISLLLTDYKTIKTQGWFNYEIRKMISISAGLASGYFSRELGRVAIFDSRVFSIPQDEVCNYFIWRQQDATRNAIQTAGQEYFSHKELHQKSCNEIQEMLFKKHNINFNDYPIIRKRGFCVIDEQVDDIIPIFTQDRDYIEKHVYIRED